MPGDINTDAQKTVEDLQEARQTHDLSKVFEDISKHSKDPNEQKAFLSKVNEDMQKEHVLPKLELQGLDHKDIVFKDKDAHTLKEFNEHGQKVKELPLSQNADNAAHPQKMEVHREAHGAQAQVDSRGQLTEMQYANGLSQKFERDADGSINKYTDKGGTTWEKGKDDTWHNVKEPDETWKGKVSTDRNGNFIKEDAAGKEVDRKDGSHLSFDTKGVLRVVTDGHGNGTEFKYDAGGKLSEIDKSDGSKMTTTDGGKTFTAHDTKGDHKGSNLQVDKFGSVSYDKADAPGHRITEKNDGARLETDAKGRVVDVVTANKHEFSFKYDGDKLVGVKNDFGNWTSKDGKEFVNEKGDHWTGKVNVDDKGNYSFVSDKGELHDYRTDGSNYVETRTPVPGRVDDTTPQQQAPGDKNQVNPGDHPVTQVNPTDGRGDNTAQRPDAPAPRPFEKAPDGSVIQEAPWGYHRQWQTGASVDYDKAGHTIGTNDGQGHTRQFHYAPNGQVDWVKGFDGSTWMRTGPREFHDNYGRSYKGDIQVDQMGVSHYQPDAMQDRAGRWHPHPPPFAQIPQFDPQTRGTRAELPNYQPQPPYRFGEYGGIVQPPPPQDVTRQRQATPVDRHPPVQTPADTTQKPTPTDQAQPVPPPTDTTQKRTGADHPVHHKPKAQDTHQDKKPDTPTDTQKPADKTTDKPQQAPDTQPTKVENFKPEQGIYNPVGPPGIGESHPDESYTSRKSAGVGNTDIDERYVDNNLTNGDGGKEYDYHGKLADGHVWDTKFTGSEKFSKDGKLLERHASYDGGKDMTFKNDMGATEVKGVTQVDTTLDPKTGNYETTITNKDGQIYKAETGSDGQVKSFTKVTGDKQTDTMGDTTTNASHYKAAMSDDYEPDKDQFNPVRPRGLGEFNPGQARDTSSQSTRTSIAEKNSDNTTTYHYNGLANDGGRHWSSVAFDAQEKVDPSGNVLSTDVTYDRPTDEKFVGVNGEAVQINDVTQSHSVRNPDGSYETVVSDRNGKWYEFKTDANGKVLKYTPT